MSALALGTAKLPANEEESIELVRCAIDSGVNYLDVGYTSDMERREQASRLIGRALQEGYREKVRIAVTLPSQGVQSTGDLDHYLQQQRDWLQIASIDFCLLGWLDRQTWPGLRDISVPDWCDSVLAEGGVSYLGFYFHDDYQTLRSIIDSYNKWTLCKIIFNYMDVDHHPGIGGIRLAVDKGLAVVAAEPLKGGRLIRNLPDSVASVWSDDSVKHSLAEWGLRWIWHHPEVATVISDVGTLKQLKENVNLADITSEDKLSVHEQILVNRVRDAYRDLKPVNCTACRGCMPCPGDVDFPRIFELYNDALIYNDFETARAIYREERHRIDTCTECGACEERCGRNVEILKWLKEARKTFEE